MKTIGLIGGMSWQSTITYYKLINEEIEQKLGGLHSAKILLYSVDFDEIEKCQSTGEWQKSAQILAGAARSLQNGGADFFLICTNTMHKVADEVRTAVDIPLVHIADATADALLSGGVRRTALLGTKYTMQQDFYKSRLQERGLEVLIPQQQDIEVVNSVIYDELCRGVVNESSKREFVRIIEEMQERGAQAVILGCTEIGMLVGAKDVTLPVFDTTEIHAKRAAELALEL